MLLQVWEQMSLSHLSGWNLFLRTHWLRQKSSKKTLSTRLPLMFITMDQKVSLSTLMMPRASNSQSLQSDSSQIQGSLLEANSTVSAMVPSLFHFQGAAFALWKKVLTLQMESSIASDLVIWQASLQLLSWDRCILTWWRKLWNTINMSISPCGCPLCALRTKLCLIISKKSMNAKPSRRSC